MNSGILPVPTKPRSAFLFCLYIAVSFLYLACLQDTPMTPQPATPTASASSVDVLPVHPARPRPVPAFSSRETGMAIDVLPHRTPKPLTVHYASKLSARSGGPIGVTSPAWTPFTATWYAPSGGVGDGLITATGSHVKDDWTIAVDPSVIPLYSLLEIRFPDGRVHIYQALDTGGAIKGNRIDIFDSSDEDCRHNGVQPVQVRIVRRGPQ